MKTPDLFGAIEHQHPSRTYEMPRHQCALIYNHDVHLADVVHDAEALGWDTKELRVEVKQEADYDSENRVWMEVPGPAGCEWCPKGAKGLAAAAAKRLAELERKEALRRKRAAKKSR